MEHNIVFICCFFLDFLQTFSSGLKAFFLFCFFLDNFCSVPGIDELQQILCVTKFSAFSKTCHHSLSKRRKQSDESVDIEKLTLFSSPQSVPTTRRVTTEHKV